MTGFAASARLHSRFDPVSLGAGCVASLSVGLMLAHWPVYTLSGIAAVSILFVSAFRLVYGVAILAFASLLQQVPALATREITVVKLIGAVLAVAWIINLSVARTSTEQTRLDVPGSRTALAAATVLAGWSFASALWAGDSAIATSNAVRLGQGILLLFIAYSAFRKVRDLVVVLGALVGGALATTIIGFATGSTPTYNQWGELVPQRFHGVTGDPNELGAQLVPAFMLAIVVVLAPAPRRWRVWAAMVALLLLGGITATASRGAIVGLLAALAITPVVIRGIRFRAGVAAVVAAAAAAALVYLAAPPALAHRLLVLSDGGTGRSDLWRVALKMGEDHPVLGVGAGNFPVVAPHYAQTVPVSRPDLVYTDPHVVHNTYLQFFVETGLIGGALFITVLIGAIRRARAAAAHAVQFRDGLLIRGVLVATLGYLACLFFISGAYEKPLWLLLALCLRLPSLWSPPAEYHDS